MICIVQLLCPARHCIMAVVFDERDMTRREAVIGLREDTKALDVNPWCGICGSQILSYQVEATCFKTMAEAVLFIMAIQHGNPTCKFGNAGHF